MRGIIEALLLLLTVFTVQSTADMVVNDIWNAFRAVSNDTALLAHIIPEMYGSSMSNPNPTFVFKMPASNQRDKFELLKMQRSDFGEPNFPNITKKPVRIVDVPAEKETHVKSSVSEWQQLGLQGWSGELKPPQQWLEESHKDTTPRPPNWQLGAYPRDEILLDLQSHQLNGRVTDIRVMPSNQLEAKREDLRNERNVYLARANDPFGYSMKWAFSNDTDQLKDRGKRDVAKLYSMIKCSTNCDPLIYKGYGCYCGFGGHGVPNDGIDRCCRLHDKCYGQSNCISYLEYFVPYVWKCYRGKPLCAVDHGEWGAPDSCAARLCQCDLRLSRCLRNFHCPSRRAVCRSSRSRRLQNLIFFD